MTERTNDPEVVRAEYADESRFAVVEARPRRVLPPDGRLVSALVASEPR